jgi:hypothetical protein
MSEPHEGRERRKRFLTRLLIVLLGLLVLAYAVPTVLNAR